MVTTGVLCGDSIVNNLFNNAHNILQAGGHTVIKLAVAGTLVVDQYNTWLASAQRGDPTINYAFIKDGINDMIAGTAAATVAATMSTWLADMRANNPLMVIFLETMDPAKTKLDTVNANRYPLWQQLNALYMGMGARSEISNALNDGNDALPVGYDNGDGLHPNPAGDVLSATILRARRDLTFSPPTVGHAAVHAGLHSRLHTAAQKQ